MIEQAFENESFREIPIARGTKSVSGLTIFSVSLISQLLN